MPTKSFHTHTHCTLHCVCEQTNPLMYTQQLTPCEKNVKIVSSVSQATEITHAGAEG